MKDRQNEDRLRELLDKQEEKRGFLIVFSGPASSGKTTQRKLFQKWLQTMGHEVVSAKWAASPLIHPILKARKGARALSPEEYCLLHAASFRQELETNILPALWSGKMVIADGYLFTGLATDSARGVKLDWVLHAYSPLFWPDLALHFALSAETSAQRVSSERPLKFYEAGQDVTNIEDSYESYKQYILRMNQEYKALAQIFQMVTVNAEQSIYEQHRTIRQLFREASRRPWAEWNVEAVLEWLARQLQSAEVQLGF